MRTVLEIVFIVFAVLSIAFAVLGVYFSIAYLKGRDL